MFPPSLYLFILLFTQFFVGYVDQRKIFCPAGKAQFPNPDDRYSFYKCDAGGNPILFPCPAKTWFNPRLEVCDWDTGNYNCGNSGVDGYQTNPGSNGGGNSGVDNGQSFQPLPPSVGGYRPQPNSPTPEANYPTVVPNQSCSTYGQLYQNPNDCSTYFMCNQRSLVLIRCPQGYYYIPERERCETTFPSGCKFVKQNMGESRPSYGTENDVWQYERRLNG